MKTKRKFIINSEKISPVLIVLYLLSGILSLSIAKLTTDPIDVSAAPAYQYTDNTYNTIKASNGDVYKYKGRGCEIEYDGTISGSGDCKTSFGTEQDWYIGPFKGDNHYFIAVEKKGLSTGALLHAWKVWGFLWIKRSTTIIMISPPGAITYKYSGTNILSSDGKTFILQNLGTHPWVFKANDGSYIEVEPFFNKNKGVLFSPDGNPQGAIYISGTPPRSGGIIGIKGIVRFADSPLGRVTNDGKTFIPKDPTKYGVNEITVADIIIEISPRYLLVNPQQEIKTGSNGGYIFETTPEDQTYTISVKQTFGPIGTEEFRTHLVGTGSVKITVHKTDAGKTLTASVLKITIGEEAAEFSLQGLMEKVIKYVFNLGDAGLTWTTKIVDRYLELKHGEIEGLRDAWSKLVNICNILFILGLLIIVFANLLRIQLDYYHIKILLPRLIIAMVMVNFSFLIALAIIDFSNLLTDALTGIATGNKILGIIGNMRQYTVSLGELAKGIGLLLLAAMFVVFALMIALYLAILLIFRIIVVWVLVVLSPVMFLFWVLPFTRSLANRWWSEFTRWVFMGPAIGLLLALSGLFMNNIQAIPLEDPVDYTMLRLITSSILVIAAAAVPSVLGGKIMGAFKGVLSKAGGIIKGGVMALPTVQAAQMAWRGRKEEVGLRKLGWLGEKLPGRWGERLKAMSEEEADIRGKRYQQLGYPESQLMGMAHKGDRAAQNLLAQKGIDWTEGGLFGELSERQRDSIAEVNPVRASTYNGQLNTQELQRRLNERPLNIPKLSKEVLRHSDLGAYLNDTRIQQILAQGTSEQKNALLANTGLAGRVATLQLSTQRMLTQEALKSDNVGNFDRIYTNLGAARDQAMGRIINGLSAEQVLQWDPEVARGANIYGRWGKGSANDVVNRKEIEKAPLDLRNYLQTGK